MALVVESYRVAKLLPKSETYGLIGQIQRAAVSIPANIAEGHGGWPCAGNDVGSGPHADRTDAEIARPADT
jgi:hypothetical protein